MKSIKAVLARDPAARNALEVILCYPGFWALLMHKPAHWLYKHHCKLLARMLSQFMRGCTGIEIHPGAVIGDGVFIDHGMGVVIGETAVIGDNCTIYQGATLGGTGKDVGKRHPTLENDVVVSSGAKVLGPFTVGAHSKIGAGAVVLREVPPGSTVVGVPGRIVKRVHVDGVEWDGKTLDENAKDKKEEKLQVITVDDTPAEAPKHEGIVGHGKAKAMKEDESDNLDQVDLPDPVMAEIRRLNRRIEELEKILFEKQKGE